MTINKGTTRHTLRETGKLYEVTVAHTYYNDLCGVYYVCAKYMGLGSFQYACTFAKEYNKTHTGLEKIHEFTNKAKAEDFLNAIYQSNGKN